MKKTLLLLSLALIFISCSTDTQKLSTQSATAETIKAIEIPFRENAYANFPSKLIATQTQLDAFVTKVGNDSNWNSKTDFLEKIQNENIDFKKYNLLLYRMTETSGSNRVSVDNSAITLNNDDVTIKIKRVVPEIGTDDMAYYALAYRVAKEVKKVIFDDGRQEVIIENKQSDMIVPKNCKAWFDGCNSCFRGGCTKRACLVYRPEDFRCTKWD